MDTMTVLALVNGVLLGVPEAITAYQQVQAMLSGGVDPTPDQFIALRASMDAAHVALNAPPAAPVA